MPDGSRLDENMRLRLDRVLDILIGRHGRDGLDGDIITGLARFFGVTRTEVTWRAVARWRSHECRRLIAEVPGNQIREGDHGRADAVRRVLAVLAGRGQLRPGTLSCIAEAYGMSRARVHQIAQTTRPAFENGARHG